MMSRVVISVFLITLSLSTAVGADEQASELIAACGRGDLAEVRYFLEAGADPNARDESGATLLFEAVHGRYYPVVQLLLAYGADPDTRDKYNRPVIIFAARNGDLDVVQALIRAGADVEARDTDGIDGLSTQSGTTALWIAARWGMVDAARALLDAGGDPNTEDADTIPAWAITRHYHHEEIYQILLDAGAEGPQPQTTGGEGK